MKNVRKIAVACLMSSWTLIANAQDSGKEFTLQGKNASGSGSECFLYVDQFGTDAYLPWRNKFFAIVRTSYEPQKSILLVAGNRFEMTSVNKFGRPTAELKVWLRAPADEQSLLHASNFHGVIRSPLKRVSCAMLHPVDDEIVE